jgi:hemerythrin superfamily protein
MSDKEAWAGHANFNGPASTLLMIHGQFRLAAERLVFLLENEPDVDLARAARAFMPLAQTLHHHHHAEEMMLFPVVKRRTGAFPENLVTDHEALTKAIDAVEAGLSRGSRHEHAKEVVAAFRRILDDHLDREELLVIPVLLEMTPAEAWALIHGG